MLKVDPFYRTSSTANALAFEQKVTVLQARLRRSDTFEYVFDFGDSCEHRCTVLRCKVDPMMEFGAASSEIVPVFGWGTIPDQYGRTTPEQEPDAAEDSG